MTPSIPVAVMAVINTLVSMYVHRTSIHYVFEIYTGFIITVHYFNARIGFLMARVRDMKTNFQEDVVWNVISLYMRLMMDFQKQDLLLKHLLRNLIMVYMVELSLLFFLLTIEVHPFLRAVLITTPFSMAVAIMTTGLMIGQLNSKTLELYLDLNHSMAYNCLENEMPLKAKTQLLLAVKELGNRQVGGQFVMGFRDGSGPATSSKEMFNLTLETVTYTLMFIQITSATKF